MTPGTRDLAALRREYGDLSLREADLAADWLTQFARWFAEAHDVGVMEPNAMVLATADAEGRPATRTVLLKAFDERGLVFYTNYRSAKAGHLAINPYASLLFPWLVLHRQVVVAGRVERVSRAETERYFASRPRSARLSAWASPQSRVVAGRGVLEEARAEADRRYPDDVPAPPHWGGYRVRPDTVEFWQGRAGRLHDRLRFRRTAGEPTGEWVVERLAP